MTTQQKWDPSGKYFGHKVNPAVECDLISLTQVIFLHPRDHLSKLLKSGSSWNYARNYTKWEGHDLYLDPLHPSRTKISPSLPLNRWYSSCAFVVQGGVEVARQKRYGLRCNRCKKKEEK